MKEEFQKNRLICGDNLVEMPLMPKESVDLIYIDPPFFSNRNYEIIWGDEAEIRSFEDRWEGGVYAYMDWMKKRVMALYRVLKPTGSLYLHCDWHAGHYLKVMLDEVFGRDKFRNEIVWCYSRPSAPGQRQMSRCHETIFWYSKGQKWTFHPDAIRQPYAQKSLERAGYKAIASKIAGGRGVNAIVELKEGGKFPEDWWQIPLVKGNSAEHWGYPTQKPEALLERIISASSNEDDLILDAFCGCGTTMAVAQRLGRRWIGMDISPSAIALVKNRLAGLGVGEKDIDIIGMPKSIADLKKFKPYEFQYWVINELHGTPSPKKVGDMGIDGFSWFNSYPIQVKQQEHVGRNVVDNFQSAIKRYYKNPRKEYWGFIVAFSFTKGAIEEVARLKKEGIFMEFIPVQDILDGVVKIEQKSQKGVQNGMSI